LGKLEKTRIKLATRIIKKILIKCIPTFKALNLLSAKLSDNKYFCGDKYAPRFGCFAHCFLTPFNFKTLFPGRPHFWLFGPAASHAFAQRPASVAFGRNSKFGPICGIHFEHCKN
jgi:hypothetical protein